MIKEKGADVLLAGGRSLYTALKNKIAFVDVNQEKKSVTAAMTGF